MLPLRLAASFAGERASGGGWPAAASLSAMEVRASESARSCGGSCFEDVRPSFFEEDWPWPIVECVAGGVCRGGVCRSATSMQQREAAQRMDRR